MIDKLIYYSERYEINLQLWPDQKTIFISKDGIELVDFSSDSFEETAKMAIDYLGRINR